MAEADQPVIDTVDTPAPVVPPTPTRVPQDENDAAIWIQCAWRQRVAMERSKAMKKLKKRIVHRNTVAKEVIDTERSYNTSLKAVIEVALNQLRWNAQTSKKNPILTTEKIQQVFCNWESIHELSCTFLAQLEKKISEWRNPSTIGDVFLQFAPFFRIYIIYCNNFDHAQEMTRSFVNEPLWEKFWQQCQMIPDFHNMNLNSFLIMPVQRIPRYVLLLKELVKYTEDDHADKPFLEKALAMLEDIAHQVNRCMKQDDVASKLLELQEMFGSSINIIEAHRSYITEGQVLMVKEDKTEAVSLYLFNDLIVLAARISSRVVEFRGSIKLHRNSACRSIPDLRTIKNGFNVVSPPHSITLLTKNKEEKSLWVDRIRTCINDLQNKKDDQVDDYLQVNVVGTDTRLDSKKKEFTVYVIELKRGELVGKIFKRYSEFSDLESAINHDFPGVELPPLSSKSFFANMKSKTIEHRRLNIQNFLQALILHPKISEHKLLKDFLQYDWALGSKDTENKEDDKPMIIKIELCDGTYKSLGVKPSMLTSDVLAMMDKKCNLKSHETFSLFQICQDGTERVMDDDERPLNVIREDKASHLLFKKKLFLRSDDLSDPNHLHMIFIQVVKDWLDGFYPSQRETVAKLSALLLQANLGNALKEKDNDFYRKYVPSSFHNDDSVMSQVPSLWDTFEGLQKPDAEVLFLDSFRKSPLYGCRMFEASTHRRKSSNNFPSNVTLGIKQDAIIVVDPVSRQVVAGGVLLYEDADDICPYPNSMELKMKAGKGGPHVFKLRRPYEIVATIQEYRRLSTKKDHGSSQKSSE